MAAIRQLAVCFSQRLVLIQRFVPASRGVVGYRSPWHRPGLAIRRMEEPQRGGHTSASGLYQPVLGSIFPPGNLPLGMGSTGGAR